MRPTLVFAVFILMLVESPVHAQRNAAVRSYNKPVALSLEGATRRSFSGYRKQLPGQSFVLEGFYPIGWSRDGKFAYYLEPVDEACNCYFAKLFILDLKTDKVLWSFDYNSDSIEEARKGGRPYTLETLWRANQKLFSEKLREHEIASQGRFALLSFPINQKGDRIRANLRATEKPGLTDDERNYGIVGSVSLQLDSRRSGAKTVFNHDYPEARPLYVGVIGYVRSPFEPRIAVFLIEIYRGYEGPPHTGQVRITGASLATGFK